MKIRCDRNELLERLQSVSGVVSSGPTTKPILHCCLITASAEGLFLSVSDLDISTKLSVERQEVAEPGQVALPAARLVSLLRELPGGGVTFETADGDERVVMVHAESYQFRLLGEDPEEFPAIQDVETDSSLRVSREKFAEMLRRVGVASARDALRYQLAGVCLDIQDEAIRMTATDGKRLAHDVLRLGASSGVTTSKIVANRSVDALCRILNDGSDEVAVAINDIEIIVAFDHGQFTAKLVEGAFPPYEGAIPKDVKTKVKARRSELIQAVKSASLVTDKETATILFKFTEDGIALDAKASDIGESHISIPADVQGEDIEIRFNPVFFIDALRMVNEEEVRMEFYGAQKPGAVRGGQNYRHFLMPLVVN